MQQALKTNRYRNEVTLWFSKVSLLAPFQISAPTTAVKPTIPDWASDPAICEKLTMSALGQKQTFSDIAIYVRF